MGPTKKQKSIEAPEQSDEKREQEVMQEEVPEPRTQELHSEPEEHEIGDLQKMKKVKIPDAFTAARGAGPGRVVHLLWPVTERLQEPRQEGQDAVGEGEEVWHNWLVILVK